MRDIGVRNATALLGALACLIGAHATAQGAVSAKGNREAYGYAMKCFVANTLMEGERRDNGDAAGAAAYDANAKRSFDGALKLGRIIGLSNREMNRDLDTAQSQELPKMMRDRRYFRDIAANCKMLGLM